MITYYSWQRCAVIFVSGLLLLGSAGSFAADKDLLDILLSNGSISQEQYDELLQKQQLQAEDLTAPQPAAPAADSGVAVTLDDTGFRAISNDGDYAIKIGARVHAEYSNHSGDGYLRDIGVNEPENGTSLRRARLESSGIVAREWGWAAEVDFANDEVAVKDFWLRYLGFEGLSITVGNQKQPYSLSIEMSSNDIPYIERSVADFLLAPFVDRAVGLRVDTSGDHWFFAGGVFGEALSRDFDDFDDSDDDDLRRTQGWGTSGRFVYAPVIADREVLHLGVRASYRNLEDNPVLRIRDKTTRISDLSIVDTGKISNYDDAFLYGPEFAYSRGPFAVFGEYNDVSLGREGDPTADYNSWYIGSSWWLTGESLASAYRIDSGEFKRVDPASPFSRAGGTGAWELSARYASIDLTDKAIIGGEEEVLTLGVNWYPINNVRFMFDWSTILDTDKSNAVREEADRISFIQMRAQLTY